MRFELGYKSTEDLFREIYALYKFVLKGGNEEYKKWEDKISREEFKDSAKNLLYYLTLRQIDIRSIQNALIPWGLSSLGRLESKTLSTLESLLATLADLSDSTEDFKHPPLEEFRDGRKRLEKNTEEIFGPKAKDYETRIMVTLATESAHDYKFVEDLVENGMNVARINCSHDNEKIWQKMVNNVKKASTKLNKEVKVQFDICGPKIRVDWVWTREKKPKVSKGDLIQIVREIPKLEEINSKAKVVLGTTVPQVFDSLKVGDRVRIDDGIVEADVEEIYENGAFLGVENVNGESIRIKSEKGLNFPDTDFNIDILSEKDLEDLKIVSKWADIICFSFIRSKEDIFIIQDELQKTLGDDMKEKSVMAKIETLSGVENVAEIILAGASKNPFSIMIARGDLAVEVGYIRLAELQQEISWVCEAANIPVVWATEVFANLVENGIPTRAEITDVVEGSLAECIMLNKGEFLNEALKMLVDILKNVEIHQYKKTPQLRALNIAKLDKK